MIDSIPASAEHESLLVTDHAGISRSRAISRKECECSPGKMELKPAEGLTGDRQCARHSEVC